MSKNKVYGILLFGRRIAVGLNTVTQEVLNNLAKQYGVEATTLEVVDNRVAKSCAAY